MSQSILKKLSQLEENKQFSKDLQTIEFFLESPLFCNLKKEDYEIIEDKHFGFLVNVFTNVNFNNKGIFWIPVKFNEVHGYFNCEQNQITSLIFAPVKVGTYFDCSHNLLKSLQYSPQIVQGDFNCANNQLKNFKYSPDSIDGIFIATNNPTENLIYLPKSHPFIYLNNHHLLKYKPENMTKGDFLRACDADFWYSIHLKEKSMYELELINSQLMIKNDLPSHKPKL